jgi:hypothetical protein
VELAKAFEREQLRYLFVGGLAVIAHGYVRLTTDLDVVMDLEPGNALRGVHVLARLGYRPRVPVSLEEFADPARRHAWVADSEMVVFSDWRDGSTGPMEINLFVVEPFPFQEAYRDTFWQVHEQGVRFPFLDLKRLIAMKSAAGRPKDLLDVANLRTINGL